ncbi:protein lap4-like isoform X3 [Toxorhynchites rutilus septentrionalis]|uniref:protein lap4-like isoform X3 n=1 Tax=Toxorhynchites rutilus septentrionalis TaxID=329112 RepID=UPI00247AC4DF|nr:protein lap4-like isoform X3 [Toxorhynchites rutilus septentrionalis]
MFKCIPIFKGCNRQIEYVDKRHCSLPNVPEEILRYSRSLEELLLDANHIRDLPKNFFRLHRLRKLGLSDNEIMKLPSDIQNFENLVELDVSRNDIGDIPDDIKHLRSLQIADFSSNPIPRLPAGFSQLRSLTVLGLNDMSLTSLPQDFGCLSKLESLELRENLLKSLPESISQLTKLERLDLGDNEIEELPSHLGYLPSLQELWLDHNQLQKLPPEIGLLRNLVCLDISENRLEELPEEIGGLENLTDLHLSQNHLEILPDGVSKLTKLTILKLDQNRLHTLNESIGHCVHMQELILTENFLNEMPCTVGNMVMLNNLNVDRNSLISIPSELGNCKALGVLSLRENKLTKLPSELGNCSELHVLDVSGNRLQYLPYSLVNLQLKAVWLSENQAQPLLTFQPDVDEATGEQVLTCFLLPQQEYVPASPENRDDTDSEDWEEREASRTHSVKFSEDSNVDKDTPFVRQNTPHPKELKLKAHKLFAKEKKSDELSSGNLDTLSEESSSKPSSLLNKTGAMATMDDIQGVIVNEVIAEEDSNKEEDEENEPNEDNEENERNEEHEEYEDDDDYEKRVEFDVNEEDDRYYVDENGELHEKISNFKLKRRDTPHHLKNKRVNHSLTDQNSLLVLNSIMMKESIAPSAKTTDDVTTPVLQQQPETAMEQQPNPSGNDALDAFTELKEDRFEIHIERTSAGLGLSIAGGKGSTPFKGDDEGIFISRVTEGGPADLAGLRVGDKVLKVNGISVEEADHYDAVEVLKACGSVLVLYIAREVTRLIGHPVFDESGSVAQISVVEQQQHHEALHQQPQQQQQQKVIAAPNSVAVEQQQQRSLMGGGIADGGGGGENPHPSFNVVGLPNGNAGTPAPISLLNGNEITHKVILHTTLIRDQIGQGLGFSIAGGKGHAPFKDGSEGIYISKITENGVAHKDGKILVGDRVLAINGVDITNAHHDNAVQLLTDHQRFVRLVVQREVKGSMDLPASPRSPMTKVLNPSGYMANRPAYSGYRRSIEDPAELIQSGETIIQQTKSGPEMVHTTTVHKQSLQQSQQQQHYQLQQQQQQQQLQSSFAQSPTSSSSSSSQFSPQQQSQQQQQHHTMATELQQSQQPQQQAPLPAPRKVLSQTSVNNGNQISNGSSSNNIISSNSNNTNGSSSTPHQQSSPSSTSSATTTTSTSTTEADTIINGTSNNSSIVAKESSGEDSQALVRPMTSADFQAMIPSHFISGGRQVRVERSGGGSGASGAHSSSSEHGPSVTVTVQKAVPDVPMLPPAPTELGTVTETITKSTFTETVMTRVTDNRLLEPLISEEVVLPKDQGSLGFSIIGGTDHSCTPFGAHEPGIFISHIVPGGIAALSGKLRMGDRILKVNGTDVTSATHQEAVMELLRPCDEIKLTVQHDPLPAGFQEVRIVKQEGERLGMHIKGGLNGQRGNPLDPADEGVFISKINSSGAAKRDSRLRVGMRILEVNGTSLLGATHQEAVNSLRASGNELHLVVCKGYEKGDLMHQSIGSAGGMSAGISNNGHSTRIGSRASETGSELSQSVSSLDRDDSIIAADPLRKISVDRVPEEEDVTYTPQATEPVSAVPQHRPHPSAVAAATVAVPQSQNNRFTPVVEQSQALMSTREKSTPEKVLDIVRAAESLALGGSNLVENGPPKSPTEPPAADNLQKTTTIVMSKHTLDTHAPQVDRRYGNIRPLLHANNPSKTSINSSSTSTAITTTTTATTSSTTSSANTNQQNDYRHINAAAITTSIAARDTTPLPSTKRYIPVHAPSPSYGDHSSSSKEPSPEKPPAPMHRSVTPTTTTGHRKSVSFDLDEPGDEYRVGSVERTELAPAHIHTWKDANNNSGGGGAGGVQLKGILRSGSPTNSGRSRSTTPEEDVRSRYSATAIVGEYVSEQDETEAETESEGEGSEIEQPNPFREEILRRPPSRLERPLSREFKRAEIVPNAAIRSMEQEFGQGDFVEYEHDARTNTIREVRSSTQNLTTRSTERLPNYDKIEQISAKFDVLPTRKRPDFVHENNVENILVPEATHRQVLLEENRRRNELTARSTNPFLVDAGYDQLSQHFVSPVPPTQHTPYNWSGSMGQLPSQIYPPIQVLPVHYTKLPTPQHTVYTFTSPQQPPHPQQQHHQLRQPTPPQRYGMQSYNLMAQTPLSPQPPQQLPMTTAVGFAPVPSVLEHQPATITSGGAVYTFNSSNSHHQHHFHHNNNNSGTSPPPAQKTPKSVSDKKRFFENAMEDQTKQTPKADKVFSFLSQNEVENLKQEEERKIATLGRRRIQERAYEPEDEDEYCCSGDDDDDDDEQQVRRDGYGKPDENDNDMSLNNQPPATTTTTTSTNLGLVHHHPTIHEEESPTPTGLLQAAVSPQVRTPVSRIPIRTANAEKRARASDMLPPEYDESKLSPSEIRALRAQKRAAWRQARLKSLENDALQAQIMIQTMNAVTMHEENGQQQQQQQQQTGPNNPIVLHLKSDYDSYPVTGNNNGDEQQTTSSSDEYPPMIAPKPVRFPRIAIKSKSTGNEVVVRETEKVVEEKVIQQRTEEVPGGGLRTVEYVEKVIETEVETMREKIIMLELEEPSSGSSEKQSLQQQRDDKERFDDHDDSTEAADVSLEEDEYDCSGDQLDSIDEREESQHQRVRTTLQTIVEVVNPAVVGVGGGAGQVNDIIIGRYNDDCGGEDSFASASSPSAYGTMFAYEEGRYESINDKMKNVLRELKQNKKVRLNLSKSLTEEELAEQVDEPAAGEEEEDEDEEFRRQEQMIQQQEEEEFRHYEEKTGAIGTVFMVRERLINDFYTHQSELAQDHHYQPQPQQQSSLGEDYYDDEDGCEVIQNPNAQAFEDELEKMHSLTKLQKLTLHDEKLKAVFCDDGDDDDYEEVVMVGGDSTAGEIGTSRKSSSAGVEKPSGIPVAASNAGSKKKKRKGKKKK